MRRSRLLLVFLLVETFLLFSLTFLTDSLWLLPWGCFVVWSAALVANASLRPQPLAPLSANATRLKRLFHFSRRGGHFLIRAQLLFAALLVFLLIGWHGPNLWQILAAHAPHQFAMQAYLPTIFLVAGATLAFLEIYVALDSTKSGETTPREAALLGHWRLLSALHLATAALLFIEIYLGTPLHRWLMAALGLLTLFSVIETAMRAGMRLYLPRRLWHTLAPLGVFFFCRFWGKPYRLAFPARERTEDEFSLKLPDMWMWPTVRRALVPMSLAIAGLLWFTTALHEVPSGHQGLHHHLGQLQGQALKPGMHLTLPYPFARVEPVATSQIHEITLGFASDPGEPILWERAHYIDEEHTLVGNGDDLLAISVPVQFQVQDPIAFYQNTTAPLDLVRDLARRSLLEETIQRPAFHIMTSDREALRHRVQKRLQESLDEQNSGLLITQVNLRDIHPPVAVAHSYQDVLAAMEDRASQIHQAESLVNRQLPQTRGRSEKVLLSAEAAAASKLITARGKSDRFLMLASIYDQAPDLYRYRETYRTIDDTLEGAKKLILDRRFQHEMPAFIDLRKVLNPDFIDNSMPSDQSLIPDLKSFKDSFDLSIEGYLKRGNGEVPTVTPDQVFKTGKR